HRVHIAEKGEDGRVGASQVLDARWVEDASGRRRILQKQLGLAQPSPVAHSAAWFRVQGKVDIADMVPTEETRWHGRDVDGSRWLSTIHLTGKGYWVWLIPLSTGHTSVGIVTDQVHHTFDDYRTEPQARAWLAAHEPEVAKHLASTPFEDFRVLHDYAYDSAQCFSADRWSCVGEAG